MNSLNLTTEQIRTRLQEIYESASAEEIATLCLSLQDIVDKFAASRSAKDQGSLWSEKDVVLITYADQVSRDGQSALQTLNEFLTGEGVSQSINTVHLLPFYPYSSDDGFSVIDYYDLAPGVGSWEDVSRLNESVYLMFDLVLNHCSQHSAWFKGFLQGDPQYQNYFHVFSPEQAESSELQEQLSQVTRPRSLPLLSEYETANGPKWVWTTFSDDQVDLNFSHTDVLLEFIKILLFYIESGGRIIRMDAVAFLWKKIGTSCIHLQKTHEVIKLFRDILEYAAPEVILLTETNVPHKENVSYFGEGYEAHMVYQFSLPPLILDAFAHEDPAPLRKWLTDLEPSPSGTTFFNFGASHDGIGVRPLEGLLDPARFDSLIGKVKERGGLVSTRRQPDGTDTPYELNISYLNAIVGDDSLDAETQVRKFMASQSIILAMPGIPGIYFHSLVGTPNDHDGVNASGIPRRINRRKYELDELTDCIHNNPVQQGIFASYLKLIQIRTLSSAFHPDGEFRGWDTTRCQHLGHEKLFVIERQSPDEQEKVLTIVNPTCESVTLNLDTPGWDLLTETTLTGSAVLPAFDFRWIRFSP